MLLSTRARRQLPEFAQTAFILLAFCMARGKTARDPESQLKALGTTLGPPWRKGHIVACAGAILLL